MMQRSELTPTQLDQQSTTEIKRWVALDSAEWKALDPNPNITREAIRVSNEAELSFVDAFGRVWISWEELIQPLHFVRDNENYGVRIVKEASN
jgi:hypothetical protein